MNLHTVLHSSNINLSSHLQGSTSALFSASSPTFVIFGLSYDNQYDGVLWQLIVVLVCIFLMVNDVDHLSMYLLTICRSSLIICLYEISFSTHTHFQSASVFSSSESSVGSIWIGLVYCNQTPYVFWSVPFSALVLTLSDYWCVCTCHCIT